jgi:hypothetical protein
MTSPAPLAYGHARTRALRAGLLGPDDAPRLRAAAGPALGRALGSADPVTAAVARFATDASKLLRSWPVGRDLLLAVVGLLEIENLKLVFRGRDANQARHWLDLGRAARLPFEPLRDAASLRAAVAAIAATPYGEVAAEEIRVHEKDLAAAELAFDRFASQRLLLAARKLGKHQLAARALVLSVVRERDLELLLRRYPPAATVLLEQELRPAELAGLWHWTPESHPLRARSLLRGEFSSPEALLLAVRRARRKACLRAFSGPPFQLAAAVALLLLRMEELRAISALAEGVPGETSAAIERALSASALGSS